MNILPIRVAVLDSGWDRSIEEERMLPGVGLVDPKSDLLCSKSDDDRDSNGHGTACCDVVLQQCRKAQVLPVRVLGASLETSVETVTAGIAWSVRARARVVSLSIASLTTHVVMPLFRSCEVARRNGCIVIAATVNGQQSGYPATFEGVFGVGLHRDCPGLCFDPDAAVEFSVPDRVWWARGLSGRRYALRGSSFATAFVSGYVADILSSNPEWRHAEIRNFLSRNLPRGASQTEQRMGS